MENTQNKNYCKLNQEDLIKDDNYYQSIQTDYFNLVRKNCRNLYEKNEHNKQNVQFSFIQKEFKEISPSINQINQKKHKYIHWKSYLLKHLENKKKKGKLWAMHLINALNKEIFLTENQFLSTLFFVNYDTQTKPYCLNNISINKIEENEKKCNISNDEIDDKKQNECLMNNKRNFDYMNSSNTKKEDKSEHLGDSFLSENIESVNPNKPLNEYVNQRKIVKLFFSIFNNQIKQKDHPIRIAIKLFSKEMANEINQKIHTLTNIDEMTKKAQLNEVVKELQHMINHFQVALKLMYARTINFQLLTAEKDEFINLIISILFQRKKFNKALYNLYLICLDERYNNLKLQMKKYCEHKPSYFGIKEKFCLDNSTLIFMRSLLNQNNISNNELILSNEKINSIKKIINQKEKKIFLSNNNFSNRRKASYNQEKEFKQNNFSMKEVEIKVSSFQSYNSMYFGKNELNNQNNLNQNDINNDFPYSKVVSYLKEIEKYLTPFQKIYYLSKINLKIEESIISFWSGFEDVTNKTLLKLTTDDLIPTLTYIVIKSNCPSILIHLRIIEDFTCLITKKSELGFYISALEGCLLNIQNLDGQNLIITKKIQNCILPNGS